MTGKVVYRTFNFFIASVWLVNGLICKVLNLVPRHQQIVVRILGPNHSRLVTILIGFSEILMAIWILSGIAMRLNAVIQIIIIGLMNVLEFILTPDLLLWGRANIVFAFLFVYLIFYNQFRIHKKLTLQQ